MDCWVSTDIHYNTALLLLINLNNYFYFSMGFIPLFVTCIMHNFLMKCILMYNKYLCNQKNSLNCIVTITKIRNFPSKLEQMNLSLRMFPLSLCRGLLFGLNEAQAKNCVSRSCRSVLLHAGKSDTGKYTTCGESCSQGVKLFEVNLHLNTQFHV